MAEESESAVSDEAAGVFTVPSDENPCTFFSEVDTWLRSDKWLHWSALMQTWACQAEIVSSLHGSCSGGGSREAELVALGEGLVLWAEAVANWAKRMEDCFRSEAGPKVGADHVGPPPSPFEL